MRTRDSRGFTLIEMLISLALLLVAMTGLASMLVQNSRLNKSQRMAAEVQSNARNCLELVVAKLRSAGWDPMNEDIPVLVVDADLGDDVSEIEVFADVVEPYDGLTDGLGEQVLMRHANDQVEWRPSSDAGEPFIVLATNITNDADGDGTIEAMFQPDDPLDPALITVQITARSPVPDPVTGGYLRYTVRSDVVVRKNL